MIATTAGGLAEQVIDGVTGVTAAPTNPHDLAHAIHRALNLTDRQRDQMRAAGRLLATSRFDHVRAARHFLDHVAPWATAGRRTGAVS